MVTCERGKPTKRSTHYADESTHCRSTFPYIAAYTDLRKGPVVLEIPAKTDKAVLNYKAAVPPGYLPITTESYRIAFAFRAVHLAGATEADAYAYAKTLRMYYLADATNPKPQRFIDASSMRYPTLPFYDLRYFQGLYDIVSVEPVRTRDKVMLGMLASIGIEPGKPFNPQGKLKAAMERAIVDAYFYLEQASYDVFAANLYWPNRHWSSTLQPDPADGFEYVTAEAILLDARAVQFFVGISFLWATRGLLEQHVRDVGLCVGGIAP